MSAYYISQGFTNLEPIIFIFKRETFFKNEWYFLEPILSLKQPNFDQNVKHMFETCKNIIANIDGPSPTIWSGSTQDLIRCCHIKYFYILQTLALTTQICLLWHIEGDFQNRSQFTVYIILLQSGKYDSFR